jgi:predicted lipoprotein with Yx(FWY)xxD motif
MRKAGRWSVLLVLCAVSLMFGVAFAQPRLKDGVLTDKKGMTLYWWDNDIAGSGKSVCNGPCTLTMAPFQADNAKASAEFGILVREDGKKQWTYKGHPLYLYVNDKKPGDRAGDGFRGGTWHYAKQ